MTILSSMMSGSVRSDKKCVPVRENTDTFEHIRTSSKHSFLFLRSWRWISSLFVGFIGSAHGGKKCTPDRETTPSKR